MKIEELKVGDGVYDGWYPEWGIGEVIKTFKTTVHIVFPNRGKCIYDKAHVKFLERGKDFFTDKTQDLLRRRS